MTRRIRAASKVCRHLDEGSGFEGGGEGRKTPYENSFSGLWLMQCEQSMRCPERISVVNLGWASQAAR
jgi:hypothetical protein